MLSALSVLAEREELVKKIVVMREYFLRVHISSGEERLGTGVLSSGCISDQVRNVCAPVLSLLSVLA